MAYIDPADLAPFATIDSAKAEAMIEDAQAQAIQAAPCLADPDDLDANQTAAVKAVLRAAILRWNEAGAGALQAQSAGPFAVTLDTRTQRRALFWPDEIDQLQKLCAAVTGGSSGGAFDLDGTWSRGTERHAETCALIFGAGYCDCGAVLTGAGPLWSADE